MEEAVISAIVEKGNHLSAKLTTENSEDALKLKDEVKSEELKMLHNKFIIVPFDNTSSNVAFVC